MRPVAPRRSARTLPLVETREEALERARATLETRIAAHLSTARLDLAVTDNASTIISVKREDGLFRLRLHHMFLDAAPEVVQALGRYVLLNDRASSRLLGRFIDINQRKIRRIRQRSSRSAQSLETQGEVHDLQAIYDALNAHYFGGAIEARITWGNRPSQGQQPRHRRSLKMGSYSVEDRLIRIHRALDRDFVPRQFVEWIVFHEMLHQKHDIPIVKGRRQFHTPAFLAEEATYAEAASAQRWERENLDRILTF